MPGIRTPVAFALEGFFPPRAHLVEAAEAAALAPQGLFHPIPEIAIAETGGDAEVHTDIGDGPADWAAAHLGREFFRCGQAGRIGIARVQQRGIGTAWMEGRGTQPGGRPCRRTVVGLQCDARRPSKPQITAPGRAGEQIIAQSERPEHAALHPLQDGGEIAGAKNGGSGGEFRGGGACGGGRGEMAGVRDEDGEHMKNSPDTPRDGARFCGGRGGWGCSGHGMVVAGLEEQSKKLMISFPVRGYARRDWTRI